MPKLSMGELEARVMDVVWDDGGWLTPGEVHSVLGESHPVAYTTVMTILVRLWRKGRLRRERDGRAYAYHAVESRDGFAASRMAQILELAGDRSAALGRFLATLEPAERDQLRRLLRERPRS